MVKKIALILSLFVCVFSGSDALAVTLDFGSRNSGPSNPLVIDGITITPWADGQPATVLGVGLGNDWVGSPGYLDRIFYYGPGMVERLPNRSEGVFIVVNGVINSFTIKPYFSVLQGPDIQFPFQIGYYGGSDWSGPIWTNVDPAVPSYAYDMPSGLDPVNRLLVMNASNWDPFTGFIEYFRPSGFPEVTFQYGFTISSIDYTPAHSVPEPGTLLLVFSGLIGCAAFRRREGIRR